MANVKLETAKINRNDEFYTQLKDIESEMSHYVEHFEGKTVYMNADNPEHSQFWRYFKDNFEELKLKHIVATYIVDEGEVSYRTDYDGVEVSRTELTQNGDFRSDESIEILKQVDMVVTNPPFSIYREYVAQLINVGVDFIIIGNVLSIYSKGIFPLIKNDVMTTGINSSRMNFKIPDGTVKNINATWFTNVDVDMEHTPLKLNGIYSNEHYPKFDNFDAIEVSRVANIPKDYFGVMGVPVTFIYKYDPKQFEILDTVSPILDGKRKFQRLLIRRRT